MRYYYQWNRIILLSPIVTRPEYYHNVEGIKNGGFCESCFYLSTKAQKLTCLDAVVAVSLDVCSNVFAALTPILETSFRLSLVF
jgi:hypothetical protein